MTLSHPSARSALRAVLTTTYLKFPPQKSSDKGFHTLCSTRRSPPICRRAISIANMMKKLLDGLRAVARLNGQFPGSSEDDGECFFLRFASAGLSPALNARACNRKGILGFVKPVLSTARNPLAGRMLFRARHQLRREFPV